MHCSRNGSSITCRIPICVILSLCGGDLLIPESYIYIYFKWSRGYVDSCHLIIFASGMLSGGERIPVQLKLKRAGSAVYNRASSLEALVGYLYLNDMERLEVMVKLGFSTDSSEQLI